jgi:hypothetical protein
MKGTGHVKHMGEKRQIQGFGGQTGGIRPLRTGCRWEDNFKMDFNGMGWVRMD